MSRLSARVKKKNTSVYVYIIIAFQFGLLTTKISAVESPVHKLMVKLILV